MSNRPEYVKCIALHRTEPRTMCGRWVVDFLFQTIDHALAEVKMEGRLLPCRECLCDALKRFKDVVDKITNASGVPVNPCCVGWEALRDEERKEVEKLRAALRKFVDGWNECCGDNYRTATTHGKSCPTAANPARLCQCGIRQMHEASNAAGWALGEVKG